MKSCMRLLSLAVALCLLTSAAPAQEPGIASGPIIAHEPATSAMAGEALTVITRVSSIGTPIRSVTLNYSLSQDVSPSSVIMQPSGMGMYMATIPAGHFSDNDSFWYYIEAVDEADEWAETSWHKVAVKRAAPTPPVVAATPTPPAAPAPVVPRAPAPAAPAPVVAAPAPAPARPAPTPPAPAPRVAAPVQPATEPPLVVTPPPRAPQRTQVAAPAKPPPATTQPVPRAPRPAQNQSVAASRPAEPPPRAAPAKAPARTPREVSALPPEERQGLSTPVLVGGGVLIGGGIIAAVASSGGGGGGGDDDGGTPPPTTNNPPAQVCTVDEFVGSWSGPSPTIAPGFSLAGNGSANFVLPDGEGIEPGSWSLSDCVLTLLPSGTNTIYRGSGRISDDKTRVTINQIEYIRN